MIYYYFKYLYFGKIKTSYLYYTEELDRRYYTEGRDDKHNRMDPKLATSYFTTSGKSFSK